MTESTSTNSGRTIGQILIILVFIGIAAGGLYLLSKFTSKASGQHEITLRIEGTTSVAIITYTQPDGKVTKPQEVHVPWQMTATYSPKQIVVLTAGNPMQMGQLSCVMLLDGKSWKKDTARSPNDKISCAGIAP